MGCCVSKPKQKPISDMKPPQNSMIVLKHDPPQSVIKNQSGIQSQAKEMYWQSNYNPQQGNGPISFITSIKNNQKDQIQIIGNGFNSYNLPKYELKLQIPYFKYGQISSLNTQVTR